MHLKSVKQLIAKFEKFYQHACYLQPEVQEQEVSTEEVMTF